MKQYAFFVVHEDERSDFLIQDLKRNGAQCFIVGESFCLQNNAKTCLILPVSPKPIEQSILNYLQHIQNKVGTFDFVFAGTNNEFLQTCNFGVANFFLKDEKFLLKNALATAEAAISIATQNTVSTIKDANICIIGFGRIAKRIAKLLKGFSPKKLVIYTNVEAEIEKAKKQKLVAKKIYELNAKGNQKQTYDIVFNTVPAKLLHEQRIIFGRENMLFIELASISCGADEQSMTQGQKYICAPGLPGKTAPKSAAKYMSSFIVEKLEKSDKTKKL